MRIEPNTSQSYSHNSRNSCNSCMWVVILKTGTHKYEDAGKTHERHVAFWTPIRYEMFCMHSSRAKAFSKLFVVLNL